MVITRTSARVLKLLEQRHLLLARHAHVAQKLSRTFARPGRGAGRCRHPAWSACRHRRSILFQRRNGWGQRGGQGRQRDGVTGAGPVGGEPRCSRYRPEPEPAPRRARRSADDQQRQPARAPPCGGRGAWASASPAPRAQKWTLRIGFAAFRPRRWCGWARQLPVPALHAGDDHWTSNSKPFAAFSAPSSAG